MVKINSQGKVEGNRSRGMPARQCKGMYRVGLECDVQAVRGPCGLQKGCQLCWLN